MPTNDKRQGAGAAYARATENDPAAKRAERRLRIFGAAGRVFADIKRQYDAELARVVQQAHIDEAQVRADWQSRYGRPYPAEIEDWERLASEAGADFMWLQKGEYTLSEIAPRIEGYLDRCRNATAEQSIEWTEPNTAKHWGAVFEASEKTIRAWFKSRHVRSQRIGRRWRVDSAELPAPE